jgi:hypothetical protein
MRVVYVLCGNKNDILTVLSSKCLRLVKVVEPSHLARWVRWVVRLDRWLERPRLLKRPILPLRSPTISREK